MYSGIKYLHLTIVNPEPQQGCPHHAPKITIVGSGFPHSDIFGSKPVRGSPKLFAAYHVLHRLSVPRHPPNALKTLDHSHYQYSPGTQAQTRSACAASLAMNMIRKTILLQHPSGTHTLQDLSNICSGLLRSGPILRSLQTNFARGYAPSPRYFPSREKSVRTRHNRMNVS